MPKKSNKKKDTYDTPLLQWTAPEYIKHEKGPAWMPAAALITAAFIAYGILNGEWVMATTFFVMAVVYYLYHRQEPKNIKIIISEIGIKIGGQKFPFNQMKKFWIIYDPPFVKTMHIRFVKKHKPDLVIQLDKQDPVKLRNLMLSQLPEWEGREESPLDAIIRALKL